jgi:hypothetical protein
MADETLAIRLRRRKRVMSRTLPDRVVLLDPESGACFELNRVGAEVWTRLDGTSTLEELCHQLQPRFAVAPENLRADVSRFGRELECQGLAERAP